MKRALSPSTNAPGLMAAAGAVYAAVVMILNAVHHHGVITPAVIIAAVAAVAALLTRQVVTPVADPRDGNGLPLLKHMVAIPEPPPDVTVQPAPPLPASDEKIIPPP